MRPNALHEFHTRLARWYARHGRRDLPWRNTDDAYAIYVSEIMLQQTQVKTVLERFYHPFLKRFPTLKALAAANRQAVLKAWEGLGYYNRAANLHEAAKELVRIQDSGFRIQGNKKNLLANPPSLIPNLLSLPGIGRNTAHAIAAFAFGQPVAVMEANVKRVLCRVFALENPGNDELWEKAALLLNKNDPFDYNQAMMDVGALVCTRRAPACGACPASLICQGKTAPESYPAMKPKKAPPVRRKHIVVLCNARGEFFARARQGKFLPGLYQFMENDSPPRAGKYLGPIRQQYSHFTLEAEVYVKRASKQSGANWHSLPALKRLPFSMAEQKILNLLSAHAKN